MLVKSNDLVRGPSGILVRDGHESIAYTDGEEVERYLAEVMTTSTDLSSTSPELESHIRDWPTEYHLSSKRANILRGLDLPPGGRVLELGCGCGAISRYLGELDLAVDAVEGSRARAEVAAMRCRELHNVNVICANFNELALPDAAYDLVVLVGVVEYSSRFWPSRCGDEEAATELLRSLRRCLREDGVIIVAIENRTGLKYVLGAHEDHYARRYVGIHDYPDSAGVRTYTRTEWSALISNAGYRSYRCLLPFPDYKVPTVLLSEDYAARNPRAFAHIEGVASRDYHMLIDLGVNEPVFWQSACANGSLAAFANSFLVLISDRRGVLDDVAGIDFVHLPDFKRKRGYSVLVRKRTASEVVERSAISGEKLEQSDMAHIVQDEPWIDGSLLSVEWSRSLLIDPWGQRFSEQLRRYYEYLGEHEPDIDLVPNNIMVLDSGKYVRFDREWQTKDPPERDYVLFRALMLFALRHKPVLREFARRQTLYTVGDFVSFGLRDLGVNRPARIEKYIDMERIFQQTVNEGDTSGTVDELLALRIDQPDRTNPVYARVYWRRQDQDYSEARSVTVEALPLRETVSMQFDLPEEALDLSHVRFDPCDERSMEDVGFLQVSSLQVEASVGGVRTRLLDLNGSAAVAASANLSGIVYSEAAYGSVFAVVGDNPEMEYRLEAAGDGGGCSRYRVVVECSHIRSPQYRLVRDRFLVEEGILRRRLAEQSLKCASLEKELAEVKSSRWWRTAERYRALRRRGQRGSKGSC